MMMRKFTIKEGDYIDSREFSREECERFCELAVECGFGRGEWMDFHGEYKLAYLGVYYGKVYWRLSGIPCVEFKRKGNITTQFREFLDKEKSMNKFTKADLKDGMRLTDTNGIVHYVCGVKWVEGGCTGDFHYEHEFSDEFRHINRSNSHFDIVLITDRDGTVLFEREEEPREISLEEVAKAFNLPVERVRIKK